MHSGAGVLARRRSGTFRRWSRRSSRPMAVPGAAALNRLTRRAQRPTCRRQKLTTARSWPAMHPAVQTRARRARHRRGHRNHARRTLRRRCRPWLLIALATAAWHWLADTAAGDLRRQRQGRAQGRRHHCARAPSARPAAGRRAHAEQNPAPDWIPRRRGHNSAAVAKHEGAIVETRPLRLAARRCNCRSPRPSRGPLCPTSCCTAGSCSRRRRCPRRSDQRAQRRCRARRNCPPDFVAVPTLVAAASLVARHVGDPACRLRTGARSALQPWALVVSRPAS